MLAPGGAKPLTSRIKAGGFPEGNTHLASPSARSALPADALWRDLGEELEEGAAIPTDFKDRTCSRADVGDTTDSSGEGVFWRRNNSPKANASDLSALDPAQSQRRSGGSAANHGDPQNAAKPQDPESLLCSPALGAARSLPPEGQRDGCRMG